MADKLSQQLEFLATCAGGILIILIGIYALAHPDVQPQIIGVTLGGTATLIVLIQVLYRKGLYQWFHCAWAVIGIVLLVLLTSLTGGFRSDFWPGFLLITIGGATVFDQRKMNLLYILTAAALVGSYFGQLASFDAYHLIVTLSRMSVVIIPAELYRHVHQLEERQKAELLLSAERERKVAQNLKRRNIELNLFNNVALALNSTLDLDSVLRQVIELTNSSLGIKVGSVSLFDKESGELVIRTLVGEKAHCVDGLHIPRGKGIASWVFEHGETALVLDAQSDPRFYSNVDEMSGFTTRSVLCIPLRSQEHTIGVIEAMNKIHGNFTPEDQQLLEALAAIAAPAIENALLHTRLKRANEELVQRYEELQRTQAQLVATEKQAAIAELAGGAAHQLNQPLTVILCSLDMIRRELEPDSPAIRDLDAMERAAEKASEIVRKIGSITEYKTKTYVEGVQILDLDQSSDTESDSPPTQK